MTRCFNSVGVLLVRTGEERSGYVLRMGVLRTGMGLGMGLGTRTGTGMGFGTGLGMGFCKDGEERGGRHSGAERFDRTTADCIGLSWFIMLQCQRTGNGIGTLTRTGTGLGMGFCKDWTRMVGRL